MSQSAFIKFVEGSETDAMTLDEVKELFNVYQQQTANTGRQLDWEYAEAAFPYTIETKPEGEGKWFYLKGKSDRYRYIVVGVGSEEVPVEEEPAKKPRRARKAAEEAEAEAAEGAEEQEQAEEEAADDEPKMIKRHYIQLVLPEGSTHGDKAKGNEFGKHFAKKLKAELHLFNGRVMYYNPRK